jgi:hypothetical protein
VNLFSLRRFRQAEVDFYIAGNVDKRLHFGRGKKSSSARR